MVLETMRKETKTMKKQFDTGSKDLGFSGVNTLHEAECIFNGLGIEFTHIVRAKLYEGHRYGQEQYSDGIHLYFINDDGNELGYYTPCMDTVMVFDKVRIVGIHQNLEFIK
jgi:hypothetical protein